MSIRLRRHFETVDPVIASIVPLVPKYALGSTPHASAFETLARSIAGQQLSVLVAARIIERLIALRGRFPTPAELRDTSPEVLRGVGFSFAKIAALHDLAAHCLDGRLPDDARLARLDDEALITHCVAVRGIGRWTAQMLLMFHFGRPDVMPADDFGVRNGFRLAYGLKGLPKARALLTWSERWAPWRSAGAWYLWRAVELHQAGRLPPRAGRAPRIEIEPAAAPRGTRAPVTRRRAPRAGGAPARRGGKVS